MICDTAILRHSGAMLKRFGGSEIAQVRRSDAYVGLVQRFPSIDHDPPRQNSRAAAFACSHVFIPSVCARASNHQRRWLMCIVTPLVH